MNWKRQATKGVRIITAIALKDILDAFKSRTIITMILAVLMLLLLSQAMPLLSKIRNIPQVVVFDEGESKLFEEFQGNDELIIHRLRSAAEMEEAVAEGSGAGLGIIIPAGFDKSVGGGSPVKLEGYEASWANPSDVESAHKTFEEQFSVAVGGPLRVEIQNAIHPGLTADGQPFTVALTMVIATMLVTIIVVPHLVIEEKENKTMDLLLVSPATNNDIVLGKALAGLVYGLTAAAVVLLVHPRMVESWGLVVLAIFLGALFAVALGLLLGMIFDNLQNLNLWTGLLFLVLIMPLILVNFSNPKWPEVIKVLFTWLPTVAMSQIVLASFSDHVDLGLLWPNLIVLSAFAMLLFGLIIFQIRRLNR